jgi:NodT family efflux transporter outer membrane factor (OMF) lipoprotein
MSGIVPQSKTTQANTLDAGTTITTASRMDWPAEDWWEAYHDTQLDALVSKAIADSPTLKVARARMALSQAYSDSMHAETLPNVSGDASSTRERFTALQFIPPPWGGHADWDNKATVSLGYDLDLWGRQESIWHASINETHATAAEVQQVKLELETAVIRSYVQLAMEFTLRDIAEEHLAHLKQRASIARRGLAAGIGTQMEVSETETPLPLAHAQIEAIDARIGLLRNQLAALSGQGPGAGEAITRPVLTLDAAIGLPDQLPANLVGRRPDVLASRWRIEAAQQNIEGAKAAFYPNINLLAFVGFQALGFGQLLSSAAGIAGVGPAISLPLFDGGRRRGNLSARTAAYDIAVESYNGVLVRALQDVSDQLVVLQSNTRQRKDAEQSLASARHAHELAQTSYRAGLSNYQHVLDTHIVVLRQEEIVAQLQAVRLDSYAGLMRALGGGTMDPDVTRNAIPPTAQQP